MAQTAGVIDRWGIDPLSVQAFDDVDGALYRTQRIDASLEGNPQLISANEYGTNSQWNLILIANALLHPSEVKGGQLLILPRRRPSNSKKQLKRTQI
jgi:hypothetical protein